MSEAERNKLSEPEEVEVRFGLAVGIGEKESVRLVRYVNVAVIDVVLLSSSVRLAVGDPEIVFVRVFEPDWDNVADLVVVVALELL